MAGSQTAFQAGSVEFPGPAFHLAACTLFFKKIAAPQNHRMTSVFVSILNWNDAASTVRCVRSVRESILPNGVAIMLFVLDNGSSPEDWNVLKNGIDNSDATLIRNEINIGFAAGHNVIIREAIERKADYIWLLNNDALVKDDTLASLLSVHYATPGCGIVSPLIYAMHDEKTVDFIGATHDWKNLNSKRAGDLATAERMEANCPTDFFVFGTAPLLRIAALGDVGLLEEKLFAYYEDDDLCTRLARAGWSSKMASSAKILHFRRKAVPAERPPYFFYLMARNALFFYLAHTPTENRRWIRLRLFSRAMITAANLREHGLIEKSNACLLGIWDGLRGRSGPPRLSVTPPVWLTFLSRIFPYRLQQWLDKI